MKNTFQLVLAFVVFLASGLAAAVAVGTGDYGMPIILGLGALSMVLVATVGRHLPMDMTIICMGIGGFYVCGKGFAYLNAGGFLFAGELMLALGTLGYFWRVGKGEFTLVPRTPMAIALMLLGGYALVRLPLDFQKYGIMALRDSCMIYYTLFFFIAYQLGQKESVQRLAPVILIAMAIPGAAIDFLRLLAPGVAEKLIFSVIIRGNPLFLNHYDAIHPAVFGLILFLAAKGTSGQGVRTPFLLLMFLITAYLLGLGRGAIYVSFLFVVGFLLMARQIKLLVGMAIGVGVLFIVLLMLIEIKPTVGRNRLRQIEDQLHVIFNPSEALKGRTQDADTADWRLEWWKQITHDVTSEAPVFGMGFGKDIATDFHRKHFKTNIVSEEIARTRGAHNAFFTVLARMGWLGAFFFSLVIAVQCWYFYRAVLAFRLGLLPPVQAYFWGSNLCSFVITFLQYSWEASYSAIPAWTCIGLSYAYLDRVLKEQSEQAVEVVPTAVPLAARRRLAQPAR